MLDICRLYMSVVRDHAKDDFALQLVFATCLKPDTVGTRPQVVAAHWGIVMYAL